MIASSLVGIGAAFSGEPLEAQQHERGEIRMGQNEQQKKIGRMHAVLEILRESQPQQIEAELKRFYGEEMLSRITRPDRFAPEREGRRETKLPESLPFKGGSITKNQIREYLDTFPEDWQNCFEEIRYSNTNPVGYGGIASAAEATERYMTFYENNAEHSNYWFILKTITHETAHKALGKYIDPTMANPGGSPELSERALYAVMQRLQAPDRYQGGSDAEYLTAIREKHMPNIRLAKEYLAIISAQYLEDPRQLPVADVRLVAELSAIGTEHFPNAAKAHQQRGIIAQEIRQANHLPEATPWRY